MFKLESYITPVILSYVEKYVKNFKPEQSQLSLWGGDASFQSLDLRLEVLEDQLNLPFTFVSGHIHELLIHVPWVKITSEPIVVTINTIECILNLKQQRQADGGATINRGSGQRSIQEEAPPGYIKSIVTKVINNITINCNNLILKLVEEDIVLSVNVRFLSMQTVNNQWEPAFADVSSYEVTVRKIITIDDLTLCLDKMDTAGKIEIYQDPVLYRCSMMIRLMMNYHSNYANYATLTRFDLHCEKMEFSMTEQQLPMLLRLIALITDLQAKRLLHRRDKGTIPSEERGEIVQDDDDQVHGALPDAPTWGGWAWNTVTSLLPVDWDADWSNDEQTPSTGHMLHFGVYIDDAALTFKTVESLHEQLFYKSRKIRYNSFLTLRVTGTVMSMLIKGISMSNMSFGLGSIRLHPRGPCSCGNQEVVDGVQPPLYVKAGTIGNDYLKNSFFDKNAIEDTELRNQYREYDIDRHLATVDVASMREKCPAFGMDIVRSIEIPDDVSLEKLAEFGSNFEYSNFPERKVIRYVVGDVQIRLCSGLMHRIDAVKRAAKYDSNLETIKKPEPNVDELPPVTVEEYEALRENVPVIETYYNAYKIAVQFQLSDHGIGQLPNYRTSVKNSSASTEPAFTDDPHLSIEAEEIVASIVAPMYAFRLASCASRQADIDSEMLEDCFSVISIKLSGIQSQLYLSKDCRILIVMPCNAKCTKKSLIYPQYWRSTSLIHDVIDGEIDAVTFTGTKPKLMVAMFIAMSIADPTDASNALFRSSLFNDACNEQDSVYLELSLENIRCKRIKSSTIVCVKINVESMKTFALNDTQQAFILSGPEINVARESANTMLLTVVLQYPETVLELNEAPILSFRVSETRCSIDPLLRQWLRYEIVHHKPSGTHVTRTETEPTLAEDIQADAGTRKKKFRTLHDSVHSLSDKEKKKSGSRTEWSKGVSGGEEVQKTVTSKDGTEDVQKSDTFGKIAELYPLWRKLVLCGYLGHLVIYMPTATMDGIGVAGIETAKDRALNEDPNLLIFAMKSPTMLIQSANVQFEQLTRHFESSSYNLPSAMWTQDYHSFPWTFNLSNFHCYTLKKDVRRNFIDKIDLTATIDIATKHGISDIADSTLSGLGLCVYVNTSPVIISISEDQVTLLRAVASDIAKLIDLMRKPNAKPRPLIQNELEELFSDVPKSPSSYTRILYADNTSTPSTMSTAKDESEKENDGVVITAMIQWTIMKIALKLYVTDAETEISTKLIFELEDIITTFDWQPIYLKLKNKITTATICHYMRMPDDRHWELGDYGGLIMCGRENGPEQIDDTGFFNVTLTTAQCGNVHTRWGAQRQQKSQKTYGNKKERPMLTESHITEIDVNLQMMDVIIPLGTINKFIVFSKPFVHHDETKIEPTDILDPEKFEKTSLPLIYLEFKGMNLMVPISSNVDHGLNHDLLIIQLDRIGITPNAENPICRTILRSDIYQLAAQSNILNIPGSVVEDRQYQADIKGISACTTTWKNYQRNVTKRMSQSYLYTMNENPALEWNNLGNDGNVEPQFSTSPLMTRFDVRSIVAPAVIFNPSKIVCGSAFEVTCLTDIDVSINFDQIKLLSTMYNETINVLSDYWKNSKNDSQNSTNDRDSTNLDRVVGIFDSREHEMDHAADSGVDFESSSVNLMPVKKIVSRERSTHLPSEILVNCGTINISLYSTMAEVPTLLESQSGKDEITEDEKSSSKSLILRLMLNEPNVYISDLHGTKKMQISCFDFGVFIDNIKKSEIPLIANNKNANLWLIESKFGDSHPVSGIPPSFVVFKLEKTANAWAQLFVDMGRPTQINLSIPAVKHIEYVKNKLQDCLGYASVSEDRENKLSRSVATHARNDESSRTRRTVELPNLNFTSRQIVVSFATSSGSKIITSLSSCSGETSRTIKPERLFGNLTINSLVVSAEESAGMRVLLNPCCCHVTTYLLRETWQDDDDDPQIQIQVECESMRFEFGPRQMNILRAVKDDYYSLMGYLRSNAGLPDDVDGTGTTAATRTTAEQYYKDDLKAGAFQFVDGHSDELPLPYQVVFYTKPVKAMAWRYPQPRVITGLQVAPIPFEISEDVDFDDDPVICILEYWSDSHAAYKRYGEFHLSETESYHPELPTTRPAQAVASVWRVSLSPIDNPHHADLISPRVFAACLRIDSYFNAFIVPNLQIACNIGAIHVSFLNNFQHSSTTKLPHPLSQFHLRGHIPREQCFAHLEQRESFVVYNRWSSGSSLIDLTGNVGVKILDYNFLRMQTLLNNFDTKIQICLSNETDVSIEYNPFTMKIGPSIAHTLAISTSLWSSGYSDDANETAIILTRIVVANDSNVEIRFGQTSSADNISLHSRQCHFYSWRHTGNRTMRIAIEATGWTWSHSFSVKQNGKQSVTFGNSGNSPVIFVKIVSLSATQKLVTFSGLLVLTNQLTQSFEMKLVKYSHEAGSKPIVSNELHEVGGSSRCSSIVMDSNANMAMRLRFATPTNFSWTGDIPLKPNSKWGQPWLVKVPLQERGQFWSIWARIVTETVNGTTKVLAILSPLYMIKSYLPVPVTVQIDTPSLKTSLSATINGRGERQQLCCPGTFEHSHQLTFQFETGISASNPHVPLSYTSVEQRKFFKRPDTEDIDAILTELENQVEIVHWPFQTDDMNVWIPTEQPHTHVQVKYKDAGLVSSTLLLELQPWCFILNTLGCRIALVADDIELCQVPHRGVITPPKLEGTFNLRVDIDGAWYSSPALHLARPDWSQGFYMPKIRGLIPVEGNVKTSIDCGPNICIVSINSKMQEDMRVVRITTSHVLCNSTSHEFRAVSLAVDETHSGVDMPEDQSLYSFSILPSKDRTQGVPIAQWCTVDTDNTTENVALYVCLSRGYGWSCPVRVDRTIARRCISITDDAGAISVVVTAQEEKGTTYISIHPDDHPQFYIENSCPFGILVGEPNGTDDGICPESSHLSWMCEVRSGAASYYSTPSVGNRLPDGQTMEQLPKLVLSPVPMDRNRDGSTDRRNVSWSGPIITSQISSGRTEQYVRLPIHGDIKLLMQKRCHTIRLHVVCMSQVDISARDIRSRLIFKETGPPDNLPETLPSPTSSTPGASFAHEYDTNDHRTENEESIEQSEVADVTATRKLRMGSLTVYMRGINVILMQDLNERGQRIEVASLCLSDFIVMTISDPQSLTVRAFVGDIQFDNQMFVYGGFDFPVVLINQQSYAAKSQRFTMKSHSKNFVDEIEGESLIVVDCNWEVDEPIYACKNVRIRIGPINAYIEDTFVSQLLEYTSSIVPPCLTLSISDSKTKITEITDNCVSIPEFILIDGMNLRSPLRLQKFTVEPISLLLSVHTSVRLYVALDHSPLYFGTFEREHLQTTPYRLGNALTMHYLSGAIFGAGWVVGSLEILGSPGGFAQALGYGLRDFIALPIRGLLNGPWGFLIGITHGSASLMKHLTAGTVNSVTKLASSVARNLDRLTLDEEHLQRQEESRRTRPQGMAQGLYQGLTGFGMSLLGAVAGLAHGPLQQVLSGEATPRGLVTGVGLGIVGAVTKPLSGAAELVALTGQGLLEGTGWNPLPVPRQKPVFECVTNAGDLSPQYAWKLLPMLAENLDSILHVANVDFRTGDETNRAVTLILTRTSLLLVDAVEDTVEKMYSLKDLTHAEHPSDPTVFCLHCVKSKNQPMRSSSPIEYPEMDQAMRARVEQFVRGSSTGCASMSATSYAQPEKIDIPSSHPENTLTFHVHPDDRNYLLSLFEVAKRQGQGNDFTVL